MHSFVLFSSLCKFCVCVKCKFGQMSSKNYVSICVKVPMHLCWSHHASKVLLGQSSVQQISFASKGLNQFWISIVVDSRQWQLLGSKIRQIVDRQFLILSNSKCKQWRLERFWESCSLYLAFQMFRFECWLLRLRFAQANKALSFFVKTKCVKNLQNKRISKEFRF